MAGDDAEKKSCHPEILPSCVPVVCVITNHHPAILKSCHPGLVPAIIIKKETPSKAGRLTLF
jgi:hypothetical protein